jgi:hypothetical protein
MGNTLSNIQSAKGTPPDSFLFGQPISQIQDQWIKFRTICDNFWIDFEQFHKTFKENEAIFSIWDYQKNELVDALEVFTAIILFADATLDQKTRFIFEMFDFNDLRSLSLIDIEFVLNCCVCSMLRIFRCDPELVPEQEKISNLVSQNFVSGERVTVSGFVKFCQENSTILDFFRVVGVSFPLEPPKTSTQLMVEAQDPDQIIPQYLRTKEKTTNLSFALRTSKYDSKASSQALTSSLFLQRNKFVLEFIKRICNFVEAPNSTRHSLDLNWAYGFRFQDVVRSLIYQSDAAPPSPRKRRQPTDNILLRTLGYRLSYANPPNVHLQRTHPPGSVGRAVG